MGLVPYSKAYSDRVQVFVPCESVIKIDQYIMLQINQHTDRPG